MGHTSRWSVLACIALAAALWGGPFLLRPDLYANDAAQHIFWLYRYADPTLLPNDLTARFFSLPSSAPWGYRSLYALLAPRVDVLLAAKWVAVLLFMAAGGLGALLGRAMVSAERKPLAGLIGAVAALWMIAQSADVLTPLGLQRSFAFPITLLFLWALVSRHYVWIGVAWLLAALFYPVVVVVLGLTGAAVLLSDLIRDRRLPSHWVWNALAGVVALVIVLLSSKIPADLGPTLTGQEALSMPEFGAHGRLQLFFGSLRVDWFRNQIMGIGWPPLTMLTIAAAAAVPFILDRSARLPKAAWIFLICGFAVFLAARLTLFTLYLPNRHTRYTLAAFGVAAIASAGVVLAERLSGRISILRAERSRLIVVSILALLFVCALFLPRARHLLARPVDQDMERAYAYLAGLPHDTLVAAHPDVADFVPLRSHLPVLASTETSLSFMAGYYGALKPRLEASLRAAYAYSWPQLDSALAPYGARVMLSAPAVWQKKDYYEPYASLVASLRSQGEGRGFVLEHPDAQRVLFRSGDVYVVRVGSGLAK
jgi:hypothetical protein